MSSPSFVKTLHNRTYPAINPHRPELSCAGKTVIVAGAGAGSIGGEIALSFAKAGAANLALLGRTEKTLNETKARIDADFPDADVVVVVTDLTKTESVGLAAHAIRSKLGAWDIFVNGAAWLPRPSTIQGAVDPKWRDILLTCAATGADEEDWWKAFEIGTKPVFYFARHFLPKAKPNASYISLNAGSAVIPPQWLSRCSAYSAAKAASVKLDEFLGAENPNLRVFTFHPGIVETRMYESIAKDQGDDFKVPIDHISLPADFVVWLASPESEFVRNRYLFVNWDVEELISKKAEIEADPFLLRLHLGGWPWKDSSL